MSTIILASNGEFVTDKNLDKYLPKKLKNCRIAFIITASKKARHLEYMKRNRERMDSLKLNYDEMDIAGKTKAQLKKILAKYDIIYVGGGNTFYLLKCVRQSGFAEVAKDLTAKGIVYIGTSAGSYITCPSIIMSTWHKSNRDHCGIADFTAMNLVPFLVKAHFTSEELPMLKKKVKKLNAPLYLLTDDQALVVKNGKVKHIGKGKKRALSPQKPKIIIVDENDKIIGYKKREEVKRKDIYRVSSLWVENSEGEILLAQRGFNKSHNPGKWGPAVAGTNDEGDSYRSNIIKEAKEELGLENIKIIKGLKIRRDGKHNFFSQRFLATINRPISKFKLQKDEVKAIKWFTKKELAKKIKKRPDDFLTSIKNCFATINKNIN